MIKKKVFKDREQACQQSVQMSGNLNASKMSRMIQDIPLTYQETRGKRGVVVPYDQCRRQIKEHNERRSMSPDRDGSPSNYDIADYLAMGNTGNMSTRNIPISNDSQVAPYYV